MKDNPILLKQKYTVLKNAENRTLEQQKSFEIINQANLKTSQAWLVRKNFKSIFEPNKWTNMLINYKEWAENALKSNLKYVKDVVNLFNRHQNGIVNAFLTQTSSGKHENLNGRIQSVLAKARGFLNFGRFKINVMFYFDNLEILPQKFY